MLGAFSMMALAALFFIIPVSGAPLRRRAVGNTGLHPVFSIDGGLNYCLNATLDDVEEPFTMQVDTGGSDTWVVDFTGIAQSTNEEVDLRPRDSVKGFLFDSTFDLSDVEITKQSILQVNRNDSFSPLPGVMGLGRQVKSKISQTFTNAVSLVETYSTQNKATPFFTLHLPRGNTTNGTIGFGAVEPQFADVTKQPFQEAQEKLWRIHLDTELGIIVNGRNITLPESGTEGSDDLTFAIDTGFPFSTIRADMSASIYSIIPTAVLNTTTGFWTLPCNAELNVVFHFNGVAVPIHPLDMVTNNGLPDGSCIGSFQSLTQERADVTLGNNFMHNVYALFSTSGLPDNEERPYIQMLPLTDPAVAHKEFIASLDKDGSAEASHSSDGTANAANVNFEDEAHRLGLGKNAAGALRPSVLMAAALAMGMLIFV